MVDHLVDRQQRTVLARGGGELAEHVLPAARGAALVRFLGEIIDQVGAAIDAFLHLGERQRAAHRRNRSLNHVDECFVDTVRLGPPRNADEAVSGEIERQFLDRGVEFHRAFPARDFLSNAATQRPRIVPHRLGLERD